MPPNMQTAALQRDDEPVNFEELLHKLDNEFAAIAPHLLERFRFDVDGMSYEMRRITHESGFRFLITVTIGFLPFSIESSTRRDAIRRVVRATQGLPRVHFAVTPASKITAGGVFEVARITTPDFIFYPLMLFIQEARPFMDLVGQYLQDPPAPTPEPLVSENG